MGLLFRNFLFIRGNLFSAHSQVHFQPFNTGVSSVSSFHTTSSRGLFWEKDYKGSYSDKNPDIGKIQHVINGFKELKGELLLFKDEVIEHFKSDPLMFFTPGVVDKQWNFKTAKDLDKWTTTCDADHGEGFSSCNFDINQHGHGLFSGNLSSEVPKDGKIKRSGYCTIRTKRTRKSFKRESYLDWNPYTHLVLKVRGDGRSYMLNIATCGYFDMLWNDVFHYVLFTRGGPYWQIAKIPFSKFIFSSKGRIQDSQGQMPLDKVTHLGITAADKINGPFLLEIDYIGLEAVPYHTEETAYEMYRVAKHIARN